VGNDALKAEKLCELAAARSGGFAFPTLWYGEPRTVALMEANHDDKGQIASRMGFKKKKFTHDHFGRTPEEQEAFYQQLVYHTLVQMNTLEMRAVCLLCGHYPLRKWASAAVREFNRNYPDTRAFAGIEFHYPPKSKLVGGDHANKWETSYLWYLRSDCVDMSQFLGDRKGSMVGVMGKDTPADASIEIGRQACDLIVRGMVRKAKQLLRKTGWKG
jgi:creatinine amidohydrolase/Fe(II)-dependent formamide hydrolase-like protein